MAKSCQGLDRSLSICTSPQGLDSRRAHRVGQDAPRKSTRDFTPVFLDGLFIL